MAAAFQGSMTGMAADIPRTADDPKVAKPHRNWLLLIPVQVGPPTEYARRMKPWMMVVILVQAVVCTCWFTLLRDFSGSFWMLMVLSLGMYSIFQDMNITYVCCWGILCTLNGTMHLLGFIVPAALGLLKFSFLKTVLRSVVPIVFLVGGAFSWLIHRDYKNSQVKDGDLEAAPLAKSDGFMGSFFGSTPVQASAGQRRGQEEGTRPKQDGKAESLQERAQRARLEAEAILGGFAPGPSEASMAQAAAQDASQRAQSGFTSLSAKAVQATADAQRGARDFQATHGPRAQAAAQDAAQRSQAGLTALGQQASQAYADVEQGARGLQATHGPKVQAAAQDAEKRARTSMSALSAQAAQARSDLNQGLRQAQDSAKGAAQRAGDSASGQPRAEGQGQTTTGGLLSGMQQVLFSRPGGT